MTKLKNSEPITNGEFIIHFQQTTKISEEVSENSLEGLCYQVFEGAKTFGDPVTVTFPNGKTYAWGEKGTWLAHQFAAEGKIDETEFIRRLTLYNADTLIMAHRSLERYTELVKANKAEIKISEQRTQELINSLEVNFDNYILARKVIQSIELEGRNDS